MSKRSNRKQKKSENAKRENPKALDSTKSGKGSDVPESKEDKISVQGGVKETEKSSNDPSWYNRVPRLTQTVGSVALTNPLGNDVNRIRLSYISSNLQWKPENVDNPYPGVLSLAVIPSVGGAVDINSPIMTAVQSMFAFVRSKINGNRNYQAVDMGFYQMTGAQLISFHEWMVRLYRLCKLYCVDNLYWTRQVIAANGVNPYSITKGQLVKLMSYIEDFENRIKIFAVPADITYYARQAFIYSNIYSEGGNIKDQMYQFVPQGWLKYDHDATKKGMLRYVEWYGFGTIDQWDIRNGTTAFNQLKTLDDIIDFGDDLTSEITTDDDFLRMSGDILHAYEGRVLTWQMVSDAMLTPITPVNDPVVLCQIQNAKMYPITRYVECAQRSDKPADVDTFDITQDAGGVMHTWAVTRFKTKLDGGTISDEVTKFMWTMNKEISIPALAPTPDEVVEATRLVVIPSNYKDDRDDWRWSYVFSGTEYVANVFITGRNELTLWENSSTPPTYKVTNTARSCCTHLDRRNGTVTAGQLDDWRQNLIYIMIQSPFKWRPCKYLFETTILTVSGNESWYLDGIIPEWDAANIGTFSNDEMYLMLKAAMISLFYVELPTLVV